MESNKYFSDIKELYRSLSGVPAVSGSEVFAEKDICDMVFSYTGFFDSFSKTRSGGLLFYHHSKKENARKIIFDAHLDTVGFCVTELLDGGFLKVRNCGGIDRRLLFASEVEIHGKETIKGVFISTPPHLSKGKDKDTLPEISEIYIDTGLSNEKLKDKISVGDFCSFKNSYAELLGGKFCGRSMDDRICAVAILVAAKMLEENRDYNDETDIIFSFSSAEEISGGGMGPLSKLCADAAIVLDVNFGREKGISEKESYILGTGCGISYSCTTDRELTDALIDCAKRENIPFNTLVEAKSTGTNAHFLSNSHLGTKCCVLSVPEKYMHTANETVGISDIFACSRLLCAFAADFNNIYEKLNNGKIIKPFPEVI